jgi:transcription initiation factor TFIIB
MDDIWNLIADLKPDAEDSPPASTGSVVCCEHCQCEDFVLEDGNYICQGCSSIAERFIDMTAEWRYYGGEDGKSGDPSRCGMPVNELLSGFAMGTMISNKYGENMNMRIIRKYHMWNSMTYKDRTLCSIFDNITIHAVNSGIPMSIIEEAKVFYKKVTDNKIMRGDNRSGLIATSIYMACKSNKVPRSAKEIAKIFNLKLTTMTKSCKRFQELLKMNMESSTPQDFVMRFTSKIGLSNEVRDLCKIIVAKADELGIVSENTPPSISAAVIYLVANVCNLDINKADISKNCDISQVTLCKCHKKLFNYRGLLFSKDLIEKYNIK